MNVCALSLALAISAQLAMPGSACASGGSLLGFIRHYEAGGDYDRYYAGIRTAPPKPLTQMTVGEVMAWQRSLRGVKSTAAGGYQFIRGTLRATVADYRIDHDALFDARMQDRLALLLMRDCKSAHAQGHNAFANCLAHILSLIHI